jgi:hypothetical protein
LRVGWRAAEVDQARISNAVEKLKTLRKATLGGLSWRELRDEGRR